MQSILDGARAGVVAGLVVTLWCFLAVSSSAQGADSAAGMAFVATAFGLLGLPQILYGVGLGAVIALWAVVFQRLGLRPIGEALSDGGTDRRVAAALVTAPVAVGVVALGVMAVHLNVTSGFARDSFQAQGLALATGALAVAALLGAPLIYGAVEKLLVKLRPDGGAPAWTWIVLGLFGVVAVVAIAMGYRIAQGLHVWSSAQIHIAMASVLLVPILTWLMHLWRWDRGAWNFGIPVAGAIVAAVCFFGAAGWATSTPEMRALTFRHAPVLSSVAGMVIDLPRDDSDIFATGPCDEEAGDCPPQQEDPVGLDSPEHPARVAVAGAVRRGDRAQRNKFESIPDPPQNVIFLMVDTLRQDHMGYAGYELNTTPNIDAIAEDAVVFNDAYATSPHTPRTVPPAFFSRYASNLQWVLPRANFPRLTENNFGMYDVKQEAGWMTVSKTSHFYFRERRGLHYGFDIWDNEGAKSLEDSHDDIATPRTFERVEGRLRKFGEERREKGDEAQPFSMFIHFFDPHATYNWHPEFGFDRGSNNHERLIAAYNSEIAHADKYVGKLVEVLKEEGLWDDVIFVITSDHGEAFNEHGYYFHGQTLYNTVQNVPLLMRVPGWFTRQVDGPVSVIDIAPTLLDLLGLSIPDVFDGEVLTEVLLGRSEVPDRPVFMELLPYTALDKHHRAVVYDDMKLIVDFYLDIEELYDLSEDPEEQHNLINERPDEAAKLREMLDEFMGR